MDIEQDLESLMSQLGQFGKYQFRQHILHLLSGFLAGVHMLSLSMVAPTPPHRCYLPELDNGVENPTFNISILSPNYIPFKEGDGTELDSCHKFNTDNGDNNPTIVPCNGLYVYDTTYQADSRVFEWNLVCDRRWERAFLQSCYMFGVLIGAILLGSLADRCGRKPIFYISAIFQLLTAVGSAFIPNYIAFSIVLFFYGFFGSGGCYVVGFVLTMELVGPKYRTICGTLFSLAFGVGVIVVAFWAYLIPNNYMVLQIVYGLHSLLLIGHWWLIDESIRWLFGKGRYTEAIKIIEKAVKINGKKFVNSLQEKMPLYEGEGRNEKEKQIKCKNYGATDLFKTPVLRSRMLNICFCWFANSLVYYGLSLNTGTLLGNPFLMLGLMGIAELPAYFFVMAFVDKTGRRSLLTFLLFIGGISCIAVAFINKGAATITLTFIGKMAIAGSFAITYNYTAELFPTVVRNSSVGLGAMSARLSGTLTPMIGLLDSVFITLPTMIFGGVAVAAGTLALFLPETVGAKLPQTLDDGENFGKGDTGYKTMANVLLCKKKGKSDDDEDFEEKLNESNSSNSAGTKDKSAKIEEVI